MIAVSQDGATAFGAQWDYSNTQRTGPVNIAVFDLEPRAWMRTACEIAGRPFHRLEWEKLLPDRPYQPGCR
jgi:hypothetical protein